MGLWFLQVHHAMVHVSWLHPADHDQHVLDLLVLRLCDHLLFLWKDIQEVDEEFELAQHVMRYVSR